MTERLVWEQPRALKKEFHIRRGQEVVAQLNFPSLWSNRANGSYGNVRLSFAYEGILHQRIRVSSSDLDQLVAIIRIGRWFGKQADIELPTGRTLALYNKGNLHRIWTLSESDGVRKRDLLSLVEKRSILKESAIIDIVGLSSSDPNPLLMALLVCYLVVVVHEQEGAVVATAAT